MLKDRETIGYRRVSVDAGSCGGQRSNGGVARDWARGRESFMDRLRRRAELWSHNILPWLDTRNFPGQSVPLVAAFHPDVRLSSF
jgi:hypothetical protein